MCKAPLSGHRSLRRRVGTSGEAEAMIRSDICLGCDKPFSYEAGVGAPRKHRGAACRQAYQIKRARARAIERRPAEAVRSHGPNGRFIVSPMATFTCPVCGSTKVGPQWTLPKKVCSRACAALSLRKRCLHGEPRFCGRCKVESHKRTLARYPDRYREINRLGDVRRAYGLTPPQYRGLVAPQQGRCAIEGCDSAGTHVDHDHTTGAVRGLLCGHHNRALGVYEKNGSRFAAYLSSPPMTRVAGVA